MATLPPGVDSSSFESALTEFRQAIGSEWVFSSDEDVALYRDAYSPLWNQGNELVASAAVAPETTEEVQEIVRIANRYGIPLYPISTGKNLGYGGSAPSYSGSMVVDLKRMNKVIEVNDRRNFAIVEPGVSYFDLYRYIQEHDLKVWIDCPDPGWGSPVGNALDHGVGYTFGQYRDHFASNAGMEVVLPDGEVLRTGMGALPGGEWGEYKYGFGPSVDGLFAQANFGIVTKMAFRLMPEQEAHFTGTVIVPRKQDLIALIDHVNYLDDTGLIGMPLWGNRISGFGGMDPELAALVENGASDAELDAYAASRGNGFWSVQLQFYGPEPTVKANWEYAQRRISADIDGSTFEDGPLYTFPLSDEDKANHHHRVAIGVPNMEIFSIGARSERNPSPQDGHLWFSAIIPRSGEAVFKAQEVIGKIWKEEGLPYNPFATPATWTPRCYIMITGLPISRTDNSINERSMRAYNRAIAECGANGMGEYRAPPAFADAIQKAYSYNDNIQLRYAQKLKDATDPNGIIAPGRGGIWPKNIRDREGRA
jgi:(+)-pinoresinol hydroxylase